MIKEDNLQHRDDAFCNEEHPDKFHLDWMGKLDPSKLVSELSIPGTHDSCARYGTVFAECQSWSITDELKAGLRYFDIRCRRYKDVFTIHHGIMYQKINFGNVLNQIRDFFKSYPTEGVVMRVKEEYEPEEPTASFEDVFKKYSDAFPGLFLLSTQIPNLKEIQSRIWVLQDGKSLGSKRWNSLDIQDYYDLGYYTNLDKKKEVIEKQMIKASNDPNKLNFYANHCSATGIIFEEPIFVAKETNKVVLEKGGNLKRLGITIMDFPGESLIEFIINKN